MLIKPEHGFDIEMKRGNQEILQFKTIKKKDAQSDVEVVWVRYMVFGVGR